MNADLQAQITQSLAEAHAAEYDGDADGVERALVAADHLVWAATTEQLDEIQSLWGWAADQTVWGS